MNPTLYTAANGHLTINFNESSDSSWIALSEDLTSLHGFQRVGSPVIGLSEQIHQSYHCAEFNLAAGWDIWCGYYLLSDTVAGDVFLEKLFHQIQA